MENFSHSHKDIHKTPEPGHKPLVSSEHSYHDHKAAQEAQNKQVAALGKRQETQGQLPKVVVSDNDPGGVAWLENKYRQAIKEQGQLATKLKNEFASQGVVGQSLDVFKSFCGGSRNSANFFEKAWSFVANRDEGSLASMQNFIKRGKELVKIKHEIDSLKTNPKNKEQFENIEKQLNGLSLQGKKDVDSYSKSQKAGVDAVATNASIAVATGLTASGYGAIGATVAGGLAKSAVMGIDGRYQKDLGEGAQNFATGSLSGLTAVVGGGLGNAAIGKIGQSLGMKIVEKGTEKTIATAGEKIVNKTIGAALNNGLKPSITFGVATGSEKATLETGGSLMDIANGKDPHLAERATRVLQETVLSSISGIALHNGALGVGHVIKPLLPKVGKVPTPKANSMEAGAYPLGPTGQIDGITFVPGQQASGKVRTGDVITKPAGALDRPEVVPPFTNEPYHPLDLVDPLWGPNKVADSSRDLTAAGNVLGEILEEHERAYDIPGLTGKLVVSEDMAVKLESQVKSLTEMLNPKRFNNGLGSDPWVYAMWLKHVAPNPSYVRAIGVSKDLGFEEGRAKLGHAVRDAGLLEFFRHDKYSPLETFFHEWSHVLHDKFPDDFNMFQKAVEIEQGLHPEGVNFSVYSYESAMENFAELGARGVLNKSGQDFQWLMSQAAPDMCMRMAVYAKILRKALNDQGAQTGVNREVLMRRLDYIDKKILPQALRNLDPDAPGDRDLFKYLNESVLAERTVFIESAVKPAKYNMVANPKDKPRKSPGKQDGISGNDVIPRVFELKDRRSYGLGTLFQGEYKNIKEAVEHAVRENVDLSNVDLAGAELAGANLSGANLEFAILRAADLSGADLSGANLQGVVLDSASLRKADLSNSILEGASLNSAQARDANLSSSCLQLVDLRNGDFRGADFSGSNLYGMLANDANMSKTSFYRAMLRKARLISTNLSKANLENANLNEAQVTSTNLKGATLKNASIVATNFEGTNFRNANIAHVDFRQCKNLDKAKGLYVGDMDPVNCTHLDVDWRQKETLPEDYYGF